MIGFWINFSPADINIQNREDEIITNNIDDSSKLEGYTTTMIINGFHTYNYDLNKKAKYKYVLRSI